MRIVKKILILGLVVVLSGCVKTKLLSEVVSVAFDRALSINLPVGYNIDKTYMRFYLPLYVGRLESYPTSNVLEVDEQPLIVSLNVQNVVKDKYYNDAQVVGSYPVSQGEDRYYQDGVMTDYNDLQFSYYFSAVKLADNDYYLQLQTNYLSFGAIAPKAAIEKTIDAMVMIARTMRISYDLVAVDYANREVVSFEKSTVDLFQQIAPESGRFVDVMKDSKWDFRGEE
jgi:hypothetical protein